MRIKRPVSLPLNDDPAAMTDRELIASYQRTGGEPGDPEAEAILAEIERRGFDI